MPNLSTLVLVLLALDAVAFAGGIVFVFTSPKTDAAGEGMKWLLPIMLAVPLVVAGLLALLSLLWWGFKVAAIVVAAAPIAIGLVGMVAAPFQQMTERRGADLAEGFPAGPPRALARALLAGDEAAARRLLAESRIDLTMADQDGNTLFVAALVRLPGLVPDLVRQGADPNFAPSGGDPPIFAALRGAEGSFAMLLEQGADPDARDRHGTPILSTALLVQRDDAAEALLARGADIHARDAGNWSTAMYAVAYRRWTLAARLIRQGVDLAELRDDGETFKTMFDRAVAEAPPEERPAIDAVIAAAAARDVDLR